MMKKNLYKPIIALAALLTIPFFVYAEEIKYFEFAPDTATALKISEYDAFYQPFYPANDFVSGFDVWVDNPDQAGTISFGLRDANDNLLASQTVSVPKISSKWSGQMLHVSFPNPVPTASNALYKIKMISSLPELKFYYGNIAQLVEYNSPYPSVEKILSPAKAGAVEQNFYFKIALYENGDNLPPILSNIKLSLITSTEARLEFNSNEPIDYKIELLSPDGTSQIKEWGGAYEFCNEGVSNCGAIFSVKPATAYTYKIYVKDGAGNENMASGAAETPSAPSQPSQQNQNTSAQPPLISNFKIAALNPRSVTAFWQTDKAANSNLVISMDQLGNKIVAAVTDATFELIHNLNSGEVLNPETQYFAVAASNDPSGSFSTYNFIFTTPKETPPPSSTPDSSSGQQSPSINQSISDRTNQSPGSSLPSSPQTDSGVVSALPQQQEESTSASKPPDSLQELKIKVADDKSGGQQIIIEWSPPAGAEPNEGYEIHIFSADHRLQKKIAVPAGTHSVAIDGLLPGTYYAIVYGKQSGVLEKIAKATIITIYERSISLFKRPIFYGYLAAFILTAGAAAFLFMRLKRI